MSFATRATLPVRRVFAATIIACLSSAPGLVAARRSPEIGTCSPAIAIAPSASAPHHSQALADQLQRLIRASATKGVTVPIRTTNPPGTSVLDLEVVAKREVISVIATLKRDGNLISQVDADYPVAVAEDIAPYLAQGLIRELAVDWRTCDRLKGDERPDAAAYAMVRAATAADRKNADHAFGLASTALAIDGGIASGYVHLGKLLKGRGEDGWAKVAEERARALDSEALAYVPEKDPVPVLVARLAGITWKKAHAGIETLTVESPADRLTLHAWKLDPSKLDLDIKKAPGNAGDSAAAFLQQFGGVFSINGGFFKERTIKQGAGSSDVTTALTPDGLLAIDGKILSNPWDGAERNRGGILTIEDHRVSLLPSSEFEGSLKPGAAALQSKPMMVEPGGKFAMYFDDGIVARRTAVCTRKDGTAVFVVVDGAGMTLYQLARLLSSEHFNTQFECDAALALDGANSTQASYIAEDGRMRNVPGREVPYAIIVNLPDKDSVIQ